MELWHHSPIALSIYEFYNKATLFTNRLIMLMTKLSLNLTNRHSLKMYGGVEVQFHALLA